MPSEFYQYFKENMDALGLPAPESLYGNATLAISTTQGFVSYIDKFGTKVTVREMIAAGTRLEKLMTAGAIGASYYVGAVVGSIAVAAGRTIGRGTSLSDVLYAASRQGWSRPWLVSMQHRLPGIYNQKIATRSCYRKCSHPR